MNNLGKRTAKLVASILILAISLLAACSMSTQQVTTCRATGDPVNPYQEVIITKAQLNDYMGQSKDISPVPASGCPTSPLVVSNGKITICHATGSKTHPYNEITVSVNGLNGHANHPDDIIPAPASGCPTTKS